MYAKRFLISAFNTYHMLSNLTPKKVLYFLLLPLVIFSACKKNQTANPDNTLAKTPTIESIVPNRGLPGDTVNLNGSNFSSTTTENYVTFNGKKAIVITATTTKLTVKAPIDGSTGNLEVQVKNSDLITGGLFTYTQAISITAITPLKAQVGESVIITGVNFKEHRDDNTVLFNGIKAVLTSSSPTKITATVPQGATGGKIQVLVDKQVATNTDFTLVSFAATLAWQEVATLSGINDRSIGATKGDITLFASPKNNHLYRVANGQITNVFDNLQYANGSVETIASTSKNFFVVVNGTFYRSEDGLKWTTQPQFGSRLTIVGNKLISFTFGRSYLSTDEGVKWTEYTDPLSNLFINDVEFDNGIPPIYATDMDNINQYTIQARSAGGRALFRSSGDNNWIRAKGNLANLSDIPVNLVSGGGNLFSIAISPSTLERRVYKSLDQGDNWFKINEDKVNILKTVGGYIVYGADDLNLSFNKGHSFLKYSIPAGYIIGGIEIADGTVYIFCKNSNGVIKLFKAQL
jgi:hypothetical protein